LPCHGVILRAKKKSEPAEMSALGGTGHDGRTLRDATGHRALRETWVENGVAQKPRLAVQKPEPNREEPMKTGGV
jgi:hypothetical protein